MKQPVAAKSKKLSVIKKILLGILIFLVVYLGSHYAYRQSLLNKAKEQLPDIEKTLDRILIYESNGEYIQAYNLYSDEYKKRAVLQEFTEAALSVKKTGFINYQLNSLLEDDLDVQYTFNFRTNFLDSIFSTTNILKYSGFFFYDNQKQGLLEAMFILKNNKWELLTIDLEPRGNVTPQPDDEKIIQLK